MKKFATIAAVMVGLGITSSPTAAQSPEPCDPTTEVCLMTPGPWIELDTLVYHVPAASTNRVDAQWQQGNKDPNYLSPRLVSAGDPGGYDVWEVVLVGQFIKMADGNVYTDFVTLINGELYGTTNTYPVQRAAVDQQSTVECGQIRCVGRFSYTGRRELTAQVTYTLRGQKTGGWKKLEMVSEADTFAAGDNTLTASLSKRRVTNLCTGYSRCELRVNGRTVSPGKSSARDRATTTVR